MPDKLKNYLNHSPPENGMLTSLMFAGKAARRLISSLNLLNKN
jgi:hypothetical protein